MMELEEAIKRFNDNAEYERSNGSLQGCLEFRHLAEWLEELKELRKKQKPHGKWIYHKRDKDFGCSICHHRFDEDKFGVEIPQDNTTWIKVCVYNFCPCCGSDNRKRGESE